MWTCGGNGDGVGNGVEDDRIRKKKSENLVSIGAEPELQVTF